MEEEKEEEEEEEEGGVKRGRMKRIRRKRVKAEEEEEDEDVEEEEELSTLQSGLHEGVAVVCREDLPHAEDLAHVEVEQLQAAGEGHPEELHLPPLLPGEALVPQP